VQKCIGYTYSLVLAADMHATGFKKKSVTWCLGKLYKDKILLVGSRELLWGCLMSAIQPEVVTGGLYYGAGLLGPTAELRQILDGDV
jgi:Zn-dependent oligopeptidase